MKKQYDFSRAERGKFHQPEAILNIPVYLSADVRQYAAEQARDRGIDVEEFVNDVLRQYSMAGGPAAR